MTGTRTAALRHQRSYESGPGFGREHELQEVIQDVEKRLAAIARIRTPEYDDKLSQVEAAAAPYVIAFLYEIRRLETLLAGVQQRRIAREGRHRKSVPMGSRAEARAAR